MTDQSQPPRHIMADIPHEQRSTIRREALEEALANLRYMDAVPLVMGSYQSGYVHAREVAFQRIQSLIAVDPEPEAWMLAQTIEEPAKSYEDGIRDAIEAAKQAFDKRFAHVPADSVQVDAWRIAVDAVSALLPKPDPAKALFDSLTDDCEAMDRFYADGFMEACRRIIAQGWRAPNDR